MSIGRRIAQLESNEQPARYFVAWPDETTEAEIATWRAANPRSTVIKVEYREDRGYGDSA